MWSLYIVKYVIHVIMELYRGRGVEELLAVDELLGVFLLWQHCASIGI